MPAPPPEPSDEGAVSLPGHESGRLDDVEGEDSAARKAGRGVLFFPKLAFGVVTSPVRGMVYLGDRYHAPEYALRWFFNRDQTFGAFPIVGWDSGFGPNGGVKAVTNDIFHREERIEVKGVIGWANRAYVQGRFMSGNLLGEHVTLGVEALFDRNPAEWFFGYGNGDEVPPRDDGMLINPNVDSRAVETRYNARQGRAAAVLDIRPFDGFHIRPGGNIADVKSNNDISSRLNDPPIGEVYNTMDITGFSGYQIGYGEVELRLDTRQASDIFDSEAMPSKGWLVAVFGGRAFVNVGDDFWRYGTDIQKLINIGLGPRSLALRFHGEAVTGRNEVPFFELPTLGGPSFLRGYNIDRFRDRIAAVASAEYAWDVGQHIGASVFVDGGRVWSDWDELSLNNMRLGFGVGMQAHTGNFLMARVQLASSIDGGAFLNLAFEPAFEPRMRVRAH